MRPDQHKQKKNSQYKRKHGIATKKESQSVDDKSETKRGGGQKTEDCHAKGKGNVKSHPNRDLIDSDDDVKAETDPLYEKKIFRRREIVSNWKQYTLPDESENPPQSKGDNFSILLDTAVVSKAQFRFKDEQDWESDVPCLTEKSNILCLDCDMLAAALQCIPVHDRLQLDEELFSKEQVDSFVEDADRCEQVYKELSSINGGQDNTENISLLKLKSHEGEAVVTPKVSVSSKHVLPTDTANIVFPVSLTNGAVHKKVIKVMHTDTNKDVKPLCTNKGNEPVREKGTEKKQLDKPHERLKPSKTERAATDEDDELDFLLSMETPQSKEALFSTPSSKYVKSVKKKQLLLEIKPDEPASPQQTNPSTKSDDQDSFEDWLNSVLDD